MSGLAVDGVRALARELLLSGDAAELETRFEEQL